MDEVRVFTLEVMESLGLTPGGPWDACLNGGWCSMSSVGTAPIKSRLS